MPEFAAFHAWLRARREAARDKCESGASDDVTHRAQGRAQEIKEILDLLENAGDYLEKIRPRQ